MTKFASAFLLSIGSVISDMLLIPPTAVRIPVGHSSFALDASGAMLLHWRRHEIEPPPYILAIA